MNNSCFLNLNNTVHENLVYMLNHIGAFLIGEKLRLQVYIVVSEILWKITSSNLPITIDIVMLSLSLL